MESGFGRQLPGRAIRFSQLNFFTPIVVHFKTALIVEAVFLFLQLANSHNEKNCNASCARCSSTCA